MRITPVFNPQGSYFYDRGSSGEREGSRTALRFAGAAGDRFLRHHQDGRLDQPIGVRLHQDWRSGHAQRQRILAVRRDEKRNAA